MYEKETFGKRAAAISYNKEDNDAPVLAAFGEGYVAERIVDIANESGVPVVSDPNTASLFSKISVGDEIPSVMYEVVARLLIFVSDMDRRYAHSRNLL
jgi:flagellar biosynthesis protein